MSIKRTENFLGAFEKKLGFKKWKNEAEMRLEYCDKTSLFELKNFFSKAPKKFSVGFTDMFEVSERYNVRFSKGEFANISSGMRNMILEPNTFEKNSVRRTFW